MAGRVPAIPVALPTMTGRILPLAAGLLAGLTPGGPAIANVDRTGAVPVVPASWQYPVADVRQAGAGLAGAAAYSADGWWRAFADPQLDALIARMHAGNTTIPQAAARLAAARAQAGISAAARRPRIGLDASASEAGGPVINAVGDSGSLFTARATVSWEADLFGQAVRLHGANRLDAEAAAAVLRGTRLMMETETAIAYFRCRRSAATADFAARKLALLQDVAQMARQRAVLGLIPPFEVNAAEQRLLAARGEAGQASLDRDSGLRQLGYLLGDPEPASLADAAPGVAPEIPVGLPGAVLARRPDLDAAISRAAAADLRLKAARRDWLPAITLTASGGAASSGLGEILRSASRDFGLGLLLSLPVFDGGRHKARVAGASATADLALAEFRDRLLVALREVNDQLGAVREARQGVRRQAENLEMARANRAAARAGEAVGIRSRTAAVTSELGLLEAEQALSGSRINLLIATVEMVSVVGGGWTG